MFLTRSIMTCAAMAVAVSGQAATPAQLLRGATELSLRPGVNRVANFTGDGRDAMVIRGWRDNGNAHSYTLYTILVRTTAPARDWNVLGVERGTAFDDNIADAPHTGEDVVTSVRFVKADYQHRRQILLVTATRRWKDSIPDPAETDIQIFALRQSHGDVGTTPDFFARIMSFRTRAKYCHADMALKEEAGLPLPAGYGGEPNRSGCPSYH
jgi:hypothetical protein